MCDPSTGATLSLGAQGTGASIATVGAYYSARGQKTALDAQADIADTNARLAELTAQTELESGQRKEQASRIQTANLKGTQRTSFAANGIDLGSDTAQNVLTTTDTLGEIDANTIAANAARSAWGYRTQGVNYKNDSLFKRTTAKATNPFMNAGSTLLTSASSVGTNYYLYKKLGMFGDSKNSGGA